MMKTSLYGVDNWLHPEEEKIRELKDIKEKLSKMKQKKKWMNEHSIKCISKLCDNFKWPKIHQTGLPKDEKG